MQFFTVCNFNGTVFRVNFTVRQFVVCAGEGDNQSKSKLIKIIIQERHFIQRDYYRTIKEVAVQTWHVLLKAMFLYSEPYGLEIKTRRGQKSVPDLLEMMKFKYQKKKNPQAKNNTPLVVFHKDPVRTEMPDNCQTSQYEKLANNTNRLKCLLKRKYATEPFLSAN